MNIIALSNAALWVLVLILTAGFLALARQIGYLHHRIPQTGARMLNAGPELGQVVEAVQYHDIDNTDITIPLRDRSNTLVVFVSPSCSVCDDVIPAIKALARNEPAFGVVFVSFNGTAETNRAYVAKHRLRNPYIVAPTASTHFSVLAAPYAIILNRQGKVLSKGVTNSREHLDSLLNSAVTETPGANADDLHPALEA